jgi:hypothetical protein
VASTLPAWIHCICSRFGTGRPKMPRR